MDLAPGVRKTVLLQLQAELRRARPGEIRCWNEKGDRVYCLPLVPVLEGAPDRAGRHQRRPREAEELNGRGVRGSHRSATTSSWPPRSRDPRAHGNLLTQEWQQPCRTS